jgi:transglutaminase-like putative cysteine protease
VKKVKKGEGMRKPLIPYIVAVFTVISVLAASSAWGAQKWEPLDPVHVMEQAKGITPALYPDSDVVVLDGQTWIRYKEDGTYTQWFEQYVKVITEKGKRRYRELSSSFSIPYNTTKFTLVEVIGKDGKARSVDIGKNSREMIEQSQMEINIYNPNDRVLQVSIPGLEVGDVIHYILSDDFRKARMAGTFNDFVGLEGTDPIKRLTYTVVAPKNKPLKRIVLKAAIPGTVSSRKLDTKEEIIYQWTAKDIPRVFEEPEMPPLYTQAQRLLVSTIPDWRTVSRWYWNLSKAHLARTTPEMHSTVEHLISGIKDRDKKIETIFRWVSQEVRYLGIVAETEAPGYEPHDVSMTFDRRAGVCRDKAALLVSMLRLAGFDSYPVLIMNGPKKDPEVPQPYFNHAVVCVKNKNGSYKLMDPTDESTRELFPSYLNNMSYLVATPAGETLLTSSIIPADRNMMRISTSGTLDGKGTLRADTTFVFEGINDNAFRGYFSRISDEEQRTYFEKALRKQIPGARLTSCAITPGNMMDTTQSLQAKISFMADDLVVHADSVTMLPVFRFGDSIGVVNHLIQRMGLKERKYTYRTDLAAGVEETLNIKLDPSLGNACNLPLKESAEDGGSSWKRTITVSDGRLAATNCFMMKLPEYTPEQYKRVQETLKKIEKTNRIMPVFANTAVTSRKGGDPWYAAYSPEAVILDEHADYDIADETSWTETTRMKVKVLTYAGKKRYGDLQIPFNPVWEDIDVKQVMVTSPSGQAREIRKNEINVMDEKWVGYAARYPAGKIMVVSMPGLEEGSTIEYTIVRKKKNRQGFFLAGVFQGIDPIEKIAVNIRVPDGVTLKTGRNDAGFGLAGSWKPFPAGVIAENKVKQENKTVLEFSASHVPPLKQEENLPPDYSFKPTVFASSGNLDEYSSKVLNALKKASSLQTGTVRKTGEIVSSASGGDERIGRIRDFVAQNIHDVDIDVAGLPLNLISPADKTLAAGYGDSADKAVLLYTMCEAAGFSPEYVLVTDGPAADAMQVPLAEFPALEWFSSVLVRVKTEKGYVYLGDTDQYAPLGSTPSSGKPGLVLNTGKLETVRARGPEYEDKIEENLSIDLSANGDATMRVHWSRYGMEYAWFVKDYREMPPEEKRRRFQEIVSSISKAAVPLSPYSVSMDAHPTQEDFTVSIPGYAVRQDDRLSLDLIGLVRAVAGVISDERSNPLYRDSFTQRHEKVEVLLPEGVKSIEMMPPRSVQYSLPGSGIITLETKVIPASGTQPRMRVAVEQTVDLKPAVFLPEDYPKLLEIHRAISHPGTRMILARMNGN